MEEENLNDKEVTKVPPKIVLNNQEDQANTEYVLDQMSGEDKQKLDLEVKELYMLKTPGELQ